MKESLLPGLGLAQCLMDVGELPVFPPVHEGRPGRWREEAGALTAGVGPAQEDVV